MFFIKMIILFVGIIAVVYSRSLFYALDDELEDDAMDCFVTAFLLIAGYGMLYLIYWAMRSVIPSVTAPILYLGIYFMFLFLAYYIRSLVALQKEWDDDKIHFQHKEVVEYKTARKERKRKRKQKAKEAKQLKRGNKNVSSRKDDHQNIR